MYFIKDKRIIGKSEHTVMRGRIQTQSCVLFGHSSSLLSENLLLHKRFIYGKGLCSRESDLLVTYLWLLAIPLSHSTKSIPCQAAWLHDNESWRSGFKLKLCQPGVETEGRVQFTVLAIPAALLPCGVTTQQHLQAWLTFPGISFQLGNHWMVVMMNGSGGRLAKFKTWVCHLLVIWL